MRPRKSFLIFLKLLLVGMGVLSHSGSRVYAFLLPAGPTCTVRNSSASSAVMAGSDGETNSENDGPVFRRSLNLLAVRACVLLALGGGGSVTVVANVRRCKQDGCTGLRAPSTDEISRRAVGRRVAMVLSVRVYNVVAICRFVEVKTSSRLQHFGLHDWTLVLPSSSRCYPRRRNCTYLHLP